ncbi:fibroblast growth factor receptor substrate 3-like [Uloborus diversus]|uniref:fibroblast growth factor receptor substrate 3-like n=1 Tax=Uloborus diversus TaxID=327109 RepID=UPI00240A539E|nr:fibroblast growth factor receptor substrate 3-like [Uloborus diversus]
MGCVFSRPEYDNNPRIFDVWNVDGDGRHLKPGWIEVTDTQLVLYQKRNIIVRWPLCGLRRYGFDSEVFSFECGRRCPTGPGVYAFKCRRAQELFTILQESINSCPITPQGPLEDQVSLAERISPGGHLPYPAPVDSSGYLEPIPATPVGVHEYTVQYNLPVASRANGISRNPTAGSPGSYVCIHSGLANGAANVNSPEWPGMSTSTLSTCCNTLGSCGSRSISPSAHNYVNNEVVMQNCTNGMCLTHHHHEYMNANVVDHQHRCCSVPRCGENTYVNSPMVALSPGHLTRDCCGTQNCANCVDVNTNYAKLDDLLKQEQSAKRYKEQQHFYMNVETEAIVHSGSSSSKGMSGRSSPSEDRLSKNSPTSPKGQTVPSHQNDSSGKESHCYENLSSPLAPEMAKDEESRGVTYALLDLHSSSSKQCNGINSTTVLSPVSTSNSVHSPVCSPARTPESYAQIDFDKTVALSNSVNSCPFNDDSMRKTRHNAAIPCHSMSA